MAWFLHTFKNIWENTNLIFQKFNLLQTYINRPLDGALYIALADGYRALKEGEDAICLSSSRNDWKRVCKKCSSYNIMLKITGEIP